MLTQAREALTHMGECECATIPLQQENSRFFALTCDACSKKKRKNVNRK
jgi:hypothetical protein